MNGTDDSGNMAKEDRKKMVLRLLDEAGVALPSVVVFRNLKYRGATFERRSVNTYLSELVEDGLLVKLDPHDLEAGRVTSIPVSEEGWFKITDAGRACVESDG